MIIVGKIVNTHGIKGYLKVISYSDYKNRFNQNNKILIEIESVFTDFLIENSFSKGNFVFIKLLDHDLIDDVKNFVNHFIYIEDDEIMKLNSDEFFIHDLIGLKVLDMNNDVLGEVIEVYQLPSNDIYEAKMTDGKKIMIPAVKDFINEINIEKKFLQLKTTEGILD